MITPIRSCNAGNRTLLTNNNTLATVTYTYNNAANRLTGAGATSYGYDADGNRTTVTNGGTTTSTFDYEDRLTAVGATASYDYIGASSDRFSKTTGGVTTKFLYDGGSVTEEMQGTTVTADYGANAEKLSGTVYWMLQDGQPSTRQLLNSSQAIVANYINDSYGNSVSSSGTAANPFKWNGGSGYYSDAESGLQKVGARYYDPSVGNWISQDSMLIAGSPADSQAINRYLYCGGNPVGRVDPGGHNNSYDEMRKLCDQQWQIALDLLWAAEDEMHRIRERHGSSKEIREQENAEAHARMLMVMASELKDMINDQEIDWASDQMKEGEQHMNEYADHMNERAMKASGE